MIQSMLVRCPHGSAPSQPPKPGGKRKRGSQKSEASSSSEASEACGWTGPLSARPVHIGRECGFEPVPCPLAVFGCSARPERRALAGHTSVAAPRHVELLAAYATDQAAQARARIESLESTVSSQRAKNEALEVRVAQLERRGNIYQRRYFSCH